MKQKNLFGQFVLLMSTVFLTACFTASCIKEEVKVMNVNLNKTKLALKEGESATLIATVAPEDAANKNVIWSCDHPEIAEVDNIGKVMAVKAGEATITVTTEDGNKTAICKVTVYSEVRQILLSPQSATMETGDILKIEAKLIPENAIDQNIQWSTSNEAVATVDLDGNVQALSVGTVSIEARIGKIFALCDITIKNKKTLIHPLTRFSEYNVGLNPGEFAKSHNAEAIGFYSFNDAQTACPKGWHILSENEAYIVSDCYDNETIMQHCLFTGKSDFSNIPEKIMIEGKLRDFTADYFTDTKKVCYALKFKDETNEYLSAYRWKDCSNEEPYFQLQVRWLKGEDIKLTVKDIANDEFWNNSNESDYFLKFPAVGYKFPNGNLSGDSSVAYYWTSKEEALSSSGKQRALLLYFLRGNYAYTGAFIGTWRCNVRCVRD